MSLYNKFRKKAYKIKPKMYLFIKDIYKKDCIGELKKTKVEIEPVVTMDKLPLFYEKATWPMQTKIPCKNCKLSFKTIPYFIPTSIDPNYTMLTDRNNFCSYDCTNMFIQKNNHSISVLQDKLMMLDLLETII